MRPMPGFPLIVLAVSTCSPREAAFKPEIPEVPPLPLGLEGALLKVPEDNPITPVKVALWNRE